MTPLRTAPFRTGPFRTVTRLVNRVSHRRNRERARTTARVTATAGALVTAGGLLVAVPFILDSTGAGAATTPGSPNGLAEHMNTVPGGMHFSGWALDPDTTAAVTVYVTLDGVRSKLTGASVVADDPRPDLDATNPAADGHGYDTTVLVPAGRHTVCTVAQNATHTSGDDYTLRCVTTTFAYDPSGAISRFNAAQGDVHVAGWAYDPDAPTTPIRVAVVVDHHTTIVTANQPNPAAAQAHPNAGNAHGFSVDLPVGQGAHSVCVGYFNLDYGNNAGNVRCGTLTLDDSPLGHIDTLAKQGTGIRLRGWAFDPDAPTSVRTVAVSVDGVKQTISAGLTRSDVAAAHPYAGSKHGFDTVLAVKEGTRTVCVTVPNVGLGANTSLGCRTITVVYSPKVTLTGLTQNSFGATVSGYATDPDTTMPINARVWVSHTSLAATVLANGAADGGHGFSHSFTLHSGPQTLCAVADNVGIGTHNSKTVCRTITLALSPVGAFESGSRVPNSTALRVSGWTFDPDTTSAARFAVSVDGRYAGTYATTVKRSDVTAKYPMAGTTSPHGFVQTLPASSGEHRICVSVYNVSGGANRTLGCKIVNAVHPVAPSAPRGASAAPTYGAVTVRWSAPASDGGAPWSSYSITSGSRTWNVSAGATSFTATGLAQKTTYTFSVRAINVAGASAPATVSATTPTGPAPQTTPAPISTSRYIRNIRGASATDLATMRAEGASDASHNPSGHRYLVLLDIGGQDTYDQGVLLSATARYISYSNLVADVKAYVDGYASAQKSTAPVTIALGTNNDVDVNATSGRQWADLVVDPVRSYAGRYGNLGVAGANDIEPGFRGTYSQVSAWEKAFLASTTASFVFNGSADGCAWTVTDRGCNNGWSMRALYNTAQGFGPGRITNLPQVYNTTMAAQWKYISLTGLQYSQPRIVFGGPLTEYTACAQANSCGSLSGGTAWRAMWNDLQSDSRLKVSSLPYSTDLRIDS